MTTLRYTTAGESHGPALTGILEGLPAGLALSKERIDAELIRRQGGYGRGGRMQIETDLVDITAGMRAGRTLGSPLALVLKNADATIEELPVPGNARPGHADLAGSQKFGELDTRAVLERASARETAIRVALAGAARQLIEHFGVRVFGHVVELGGERFAPSDVRGDAQGDGLGDAELPPVDEREQRRDASQFYSLFPERDEAFIAKVDAAKEAGDTLGGVFEVRAWGLPPGLGSHASGPERLTSRLAGALMSIPAMKGVEFGLGFEAARRPGSRVHDAIDPAEASDSADGSDPVASPNGRFRRRTNNAGGLEGGMTTGEELVVRVAMKPISTLRRGLDTVDFETNETVRATYQRSDVTAAPAASVVGEALVAFELARAWREKFGGDAMSQVTAAVEFYREQLRSL
ncbi:Chorismate synthase [Planctomycetes bacterium Pla163]|uniref:Chorismate synthase n=1 Tax=Rohdeia mirabilis TaxID=2528008 RepID=A0A518D2Y7_9BACT|nr:Chorismate synthase [Planctomycetes bacterium Pla163]